MPASVQAFYFLFLWNGAISYKVKEGHLSPPFECYISNTSILFVNRTIPFLSILTGPVKFIIPQSIAKV
jgi:hypothetical protein